MAFQQTPQNAQNAGGPVAPLRIERGAEVFCTDGAYGTVQQVVMDPRTSELQGIVVQPLGAKGEVVIGIIHIARASDDQVYLDCSRRAIRNDPTIAQPYNPERYTPVSPRAGVSRKRAAGIASAADQPVVTDLGPKPWSDAPAHEALREGQPPAPSAAPPAAPRGRQPAVPGEQGAAGWRTPGSIASVEPKRLGPKETQAALHETRRGEQPRPTPARTTTPLFSGRSLETPQAPPNPASVAPLNTPSTTTSAQPPMRQMAPPAWLTPALLAAGTLALVGGVTVGALAWQRSRRPTGLDWWRAQLTHFARNPQKASRKVAKTVSQTVARNVQGWKPELASATAQASTQVDAWRSLLGEQIETWRETTETTGEQAVSNLKQFQKTASKNASKRLKGWTATLGVLGVLAGDQLQELGDTLGNQVEDWRDVLGGALMSNSPSFPQSLSASAKAVTNAPHRAMRRGVVGMRWFRRGIFFGALVGAIAGLLFAPVPGSQLRAAIANWFQQLGGQAQNVATSALNTAQRATSSTSGTATGSATGTTAGARTSPAGGSRERARLART